MVLAAGPFGLGPMELVIILLVLVMLFGATRLADLGGSLGKGIKEFRKEIKAEDEEEEPAPAPRAQAMASGTKGNEVGVETVSAIKCPSCGSLNPVGARHCNQCGTSIATPVS
jgi:sec-independent protein translocase protein TatA